MPIPNMIVLTAALIVASICIFLVFHEDYEDGFVGRLALSLIGMSASGRVLQLAEDATRYVSSVGLVLWIGLALFLGQTLFRFLMWRYAGKTPWREQPK